MLLNQQHESLTKIAYESNYYDQAHFIKDFKEFTGTNPKDFLADERLLLSAIFYSRRLACRIFTIFDFFSSLGLLCNQKQMSMKNLISIVEIPTIEFPRAVKFYQTILNTSIEEINMDGALMGLFPSDGETVSVALINSTQIKLQWMVLWFISMPEMIYK